LIVPSKFYGIAAAGRPVIAVTAREGDIARLVRRHGCGAVVEPGDGAGLADLLLRLLDEPGKVAEMGRQAREVIDAHFSRRRAFAHWEALLDDIG